MKPLVYLACFASAVALAFAQQNKSSTVSAASLPAASSAASGSPSIVGTYKLVSRKLPDGRMLYPPTLDGLWSITPTMMNFHIVTETSPGKPAFGSFISNYRMTATEFTETRTINSWIEDGKVTDARFTGSKTVPVKVVGSRIEFTPPSAKGPQGELTPPLHVFDGNTLVASKAGEFIDTWEKVKEPGIGSAPRSAVQVDHDRKAILAVSDEHMLAVNLLNPERLLATYTDDIVNLIPDQPPLVGLAASRVFVPARHAEIGSIKVVRHLDQIEIHGDLAVERGTISGNLTMKGKSDSQPIDLKYVWVWRRQPNGSWKTAYNITNQNAAR